MEEIMSYHIRYHMFPMYQLALTFSNSELSFGVTCKHNQVSCTWVNQWIPSLYESADFSAASVSAKRSWL